MTLRVIEKTNSRLKFLYRKNRFLDVHFRRLSCNALIQPQIRQITKGKAASYTKQM